MKSESSFIIHWDSDLLRFYYSHLFHQNYVAALWRDVKEH